MLGFSFRLTGRIFIFRNLFKLFFVYYLFGFFTFFLFF
jgi:hypothetical protein